MGLYDDLELTEDVQLPDGEPTRTGFQTKSLDCSMSLYRITAAGIQEHRCDWEEHGQPRPHPVFKGKMIRDRRRINERWVDIPFHGDVHFYGQVFETEMEGLRKYRRLSYVARFTDGRLEWIKEEPDHGKLW